MFLNILLEVILITILVGGSYYGYNNGLFRIAARPARLLLCLAVSLSFCKTVGGFFIAPVIRNWIDAKFQDIAAPIIGAVSTAIAFLVIFTVLKVVLSLVISLAGKFLDVGIIGKINRALGFVLSGTLAFLFAICFAGFIQYVFELEAFDNSSLVKEFSGGPLYRLFVWISPIRMTFLQ